MTEIVAARPFLKWAGGKTYLLPEIKKRIPAAWNPETDLYIEPFLGAGALFWHLQPKRACLSDANEELFVTWLAFESCYVEEFFALLEQLQCYYSTATDPKAVFAAWRAFAPSPSEIATRAARMMFLNKTCFNGLYRVNKDGQFNVPWGKNLKATIFDRPNLLACRDTLRTCDLNLNCSDFENVHRPMPGSLWYADPPYVPISKTANFTAYTADGFTYVDQLRLLVHAAQLKAEGVYVILSQAADEPLIAQYRRCGFTCDLVQVPRRVNSKGAGRGLVGEYIIY